jgi:xanthine dehydrogenase YagS FAD-binding subunit
MRFDLVLPENIEEALEQKRDTDRWFAGGTDLLPELKTEVARPARLVNLKQIQGLDHVEATADGIQIGGLTTLAALAEDERIRAHYRALAQACDVSASPQIRSAATLAGNLNQDSRCAYWRNGFPCYLHGGDRCHAREGEHREAAVTGYADCVHVHPSDPANGLVVFQAEILTRGRAGERRIPAESFFSAPTAQDPRMNVLEPDEVIMSIALPGVSSNTRSAYVKAMDRASWAFALASAAVQVEIEQGLVKSARVVLGGVAPVPWRERQVESLLTGERWDESVIIRASRGALADARPLPQTGYKVRLARAMIRRALKECLA